MALSTILPDKATLQEQNEILRGILSSTGSADNARSVSLLFDGTAATYKSVMRKWFRDNGVNAMTSTGITDLVDKWYNLTRPDWDGGVEFYQPDVSAVSTGTGTGDNADMTCTPSTDTVAGQDDYAGNPLFACVDCNWEVDADTLEPVITAIDGITDGFKRADTGTYVGVLQMSGYVYWMEKDETYTVGYASTRSGPYGNNIYPLPECVKMDGTVREWMVHGKYVSHTVDGKMTCCSGLIPTAFVSHNTIHTLSAANGAQYSGMTCADDAFLKLMAMLKYKTLTLDGIMQGCVSMNYQYYAKVGESGVKRVIITATQAANLEVGMNVLIGAYSDSASSPTDRNTAAVYSVTGQAGAKITKIESYAVDGDETEYCAVYVDTDDTFDTSANGDTTDGTTLISTFHWDTGTTDTVLGNDGSPKSNTSGKYPYKIQGVECMNGAYDVIADSILSLYADDDGVYWYEPYVVKQSANQSTAITANYVASGVKCKQADTTTTWLYIKKNGYSTNTGLLFPSETGGSSSTYTRDAFYALAATTGTREWRARGSLGNGSGAAGLSYVHGGSALSYASWNFVARLSPTGNRGEWVA